MPRKKAAVKSENATEAKVETLKVDAVETKEAPEVKETEAPEVKETEAPEVKETEAKEALGSPEVPEKKPSKKSAKVIKVMPTKGMLHEPFQNIRINEGVITPVEETSWVVCQIKAGLLKKC